MAINAEQTFSLDLSLFGSKVSDLAPSNLPAGVSPDCSNMFFFAQGVCSRPAFIHAMSAGIGAAAIMSHAPYTPPGGIYAMVELDSDLNIWEYNVQSAESEELFTLSPWLSAAGQQKYMNGAQLFDKFFMAFFDPGNGLNPFSSAADVPRYINALGHCNRVTIDAPGGGLSIESVNLENLFNPSNFSVQTAFTRAGNIVTVTLDSYDGEYPNPMPIPGWFLQMYDKDALTPSFNYSSSWNRESPLNSAAVQAAGPGSNQPGNILSIYYCTSNSGGVPDSTLLDAFQAAQAGGYTLYIQIANPVIGPSGVFPVTAVATANESIYFPYPNNNGGSNYESRPYFYVSYLVPGPAIYQGNNAIPPDTTATYAISTTAITPDGTNINGNGMFENNELYQQVGGTVAMSSDGSGVTKITCGTAITNLPIGAWLYLVIPADQDLPFATGWVQVASVVNEYQFAISTPGAQLFNFSGVSLFEYWGSLNTSASLTQPVPGNPVGTSFAQTGAQGFQITSVTKLGNGKIQLQWYQLGPDSINGADAGRMALTPQSAETPGNRQAFCFFINEDGAPSPGSPPINFTTLGGPNFTLITFPLGPSPTVTRALSVTPANGADFFTLPPANVPSSAGPIITPGMIVYDNETTSAYIDWSDAALVGSIPTSGTAGAGSDFGDLTSTINLPPCLAVEAYEDALAWIGEYNNIKNLLNMSFQGGCAEFSGDDPTGAPLGWDQTDAHGGITPDQSETLALASDGSGWMLTFPNLSGNHNGMISQSLYQDIWGAPILQPNQEYILVVRAAATGSDLTGGQLNFVIQSDSEDTVYASATVDVTALTTTLSWIKIQFNEPDSSTLASMPSAIPSDMRLLVYRSGSNVNTIDIADAFIINANSPVLSNQLRISYPANPFGYDDENGYVIITAAADPIVSMFKQRKYLYANTTKDLLQTFDTGEVPSEWGLDIFAENCGSSGPNAVDAQDDIAWWIGRQGVQAFDGSRPKKISQEMEPDFLAINWAYRNIIGLASDPIQRVVYITAPINGNLLSNNIFTMNHRMVDPSVNITDPIHISTYTGKMIATDLARKWCPWPVACNSLAMCYVELEDELTQAMTFGLGGVGPTQPDAESSANGSTTAIAVSLTPPNATDFLLVSTNQYDAAAPADWTKVANAGGFYSYQSDIDEEVSFNATGGGIGIDGWIALIASVQTTAGAASLVQSASLGSGFIGSGAHNITLTNPVVDGDAIIVQVSMNTYSGGNISVMDNQGNNYKIYQQYMTIGGSPVGAALAVALGCKGGSTTVTITLGGNIGSGIGTVAEFSGIAGYEVFGQVYAQDFVNYPPTNPAYTEWNTEDADYGDYASYYDTYFFFAHDVEQNAMLALYRKLFAYMSTHIVGSGDLTITPYVDALSVPWTALPTLTMQETDPGYDYEFGMNVTGNRMALEYSCKSGAFWLTHLIVSARRELVFPVRGVL